MRNVGGALRISMVTWQVLTLWLIMHVAGIILYVIGLSLSKTKVNKFLSFIKSVSYTECTGRACTLIWLENP